MKKIILLKGLPASGKTTWAKELIAKEPGKWKRINKDDLRAMLDDSKWSKENEKFVLNVRDFLIKLALRLEYNVIVDDTNLHPKHLDHIKSEFENIESVKVEVKEFLTSLEECIRRDQKRSNYVGEKVIKQMYNQFIKSVTPMVEPDIDLKDVIICDVDGTLALFGDANPYDRDFTKDEVNQPIRRLLLGVGSGDVEIIFVSGRDGKFRKQTEQWFEKHWGSNFKLFMRKPNDSRKDVIVKQEIYEAEIKGKYNVLFVLDDRDQVVEFWRSQGLTCLQVADGDF